MSAQISAPVRILALLGLVAALGMGAWTFALGRTSTSTSANDTGEPSAPIAAAQSAATKLTAHDRATATGTAAPAPVAKPPGAHAAKAAAKPAAAGPDAVMPAAAKAAQTARPAASLVPDGTPATIASALRAHRVVVVLLYDPESQVDAYSVGEARVGAAQAKAGFLRVNVLKQRQAAPFTKAYEILHAPALLFFTRPGKLVQKLEGFADHETVAQAAVNARHGVVVPLG